MELGTLKNYLGSGGKQNLFSQTRSVSESSLWSENRANGVADSIQGGGGMVVAGGLHDGAARGGRRDLTIETNPKKDFKDDVCSITASPTAGFAGSRCNKGVGGADLGDLGLQIIDDLNKDLQKLQKCVTCVICHDMLFEPFSLQCGHVFCYTVCDTLDTLYTTFGALHQANNDFIQPSAWWIG